MNKNESYYLKKGGKIGNPGLPGGTLDAKKEAIKITDKHLEVIGKNIDFLVSKGIVVTGSDMKKLDEVEADKKAEAKKEKKEAKKVEPKKEWSDD